MPIYFLKEALADFRARYNECRDNYKQITQDIKQSAKGSRVQASRNFQAKLKQMEERKKLIRNLKRNHPLFMEYLAYIREEYLEVFEERSRMRRELDRRLARRLRKLWMKHKYELAELCCDFIRCCNYFR